MSLYTSGEMARLPGITSGKSWLPPFIHTITIRPPARTRRQKRCIKALYHVCLVHFVLNNASYASFFAERPSKLRNYLRMKNNSFVSHYTKRHKQQKWTLKTFQANKFSKSKIAICFSLLPVFPFVLFLYLSCHLFIISISWAIYIFFNWWQFSPFEFW